MRPTTPTPHPKTHHEAAAELERERRVSQNSMQSESDLYAFFHQLKPWRFENRSPIGNPQCVHVLDGRCSEPRTSIKM